MYTWCGVTADIDLPDLHKLMARAQKGRDYGILQAVIDARVAERSVPLSTMRAPLAATKLTDEVFRNFQPISERHTFGEGLSPFTCVCKGHAEALKVRQKTKSWKGEAPSP